MHRVKPIIAATPEDLAGALQLPTATAKEWQVQHALLKRLKEIVRKNKLTHAKSRSGRARRERESPPS